MQSNALRIRCYTYIRRVKRREGKPQRVCRSRKGSTHSPLGRLGKAILARAVRWGNPTGETPPTTGAFLCAQSWLLAKSRIRLILQTPPRVNQYCPRKRATEAKAGSGTVREPSEARDGRGRGEGAALNVYFRNCKQSFNQSYAP